MDKEQDIAFMNEYINENYDEIQRWVKYNEHVKRLQQPDDINIDIIEPVMKYEDWQKLERACWR